MVKVLKVPMFKGSYDYSFLIINVLNVRKGFYGFSWLKVLKVINSAAYRIPNLRIQALFDRRDSNQCCRGVDQIAEEHIAFCPASEQKRAVDLAEESIHERFPAVVGTKILKYWCFPFSKENLRWHLIRLAFGRLQGVQKVADFRPKLYVVVVGVLQTSF